MKQYLRFDFDHYDAGGGWWDFSDSFDTVEQAMAFEEAPGRAPSDYSQIVDTKLGRVILERSGRGEWKLST